MLTQFKLVTIFFHYLKIGKPVITKHLLVANDVSFRMNIEYSYVIDVVKAITIFYTFTAYWCRHRTTWEQYN